MHATVADQQFVAATAATLRWQPTDSDGEPADPGAVTVGVVNSAGTVVVAAGAATTVADDEARTYVLTAAQTASVDFLTATWSVGSVVVATTVAEVIGRAIMSKAEFEAREPKAEASLEEFLIARREVDDLFRREAKRAFTPRFCVERVPRSRGKALPLTFPDLREVRWASHIATDGTVTAITGASSIGPSAAGIALLGSCWPTTGEVEIGYVHGTDRPAADVLGAMAKLIRHTVGGGTSSIPDRATIYTDAQGGVTQLATPGSEWFITGIAEVDTVIIDNRWKGGTFA